MEKKTCKLFTKICSTGSCIRYDIARAVVVGDGCAKSIRAVRIVLLHHEMAYVRLAVTVFVRATRARVVASAGDVVRWRNVPPHARNPETAYGAAILQVVVLLLTTIALGCQHKFGWNLVR